MKTQQEKISLKGDVIRLKVAGRSDANKVASAIARYLDEGATVTLAAIGAGAVNQAVKALCHARGLVAPKGLDLCFIPGFSDENLDGVIKSGITIRVLYRT
jgi:stage V sporulation protein S